MRREQRVPSPRARRRLHPGRSSRPNGPRPQLPRTQATPRRRCEPQSSPPYVSLKRRLPAPVKALVPGRFRPRPNPRPPRQRRREQAQPLPLKLLVLASRQLPARWVNRRARARLHPRQHLPPHPSASLERLRARHPRRRHVTQVRRLRHQRHPLRQHASRVRRPPLLLARREAQEQARRRANQVRPQPPRRFVRQDLPRRPGRRLVHVLARRAPGRPRRAVRPRARPLAVRMRNNQAPPCSHRQVSRFLRRPAFAGRRRRRQASRSLRLQVVVPVPRAPHPALVGAAPPAPVLGDPRAPEEGSAARRALRPAEPAGAAAVTAAALPVAVDSGEVARVAAVLRERARVRAPVAVRSETGAVPADAGRPAGAGATSRSSKLRS